MAGGKFSEAKLHGMTIRESANDGSDFTNPDADYRRLFLGEDGSLHLKDSAGSVTDIGGAITEITDIPTAETDTDLRLAPDGAGGVEWAAGGGGGIDSGTAFPGGPSTGDLFFRTDRGLAYYYDGTRWLCLCPHTVPLHPTDTIAFSGVSGNVTAAARCVIPYKGTYSIYAERWEVTTIVTTTNDGTHNWSAQLTSQPSPTSLGSAISTSADSASTHTYHSAAIGAVINTSDHYLNVGVTKNSSPGNLFFSGAPVLHFRFVG